MLKCPHCKSANITGTAIVKVYFTPDRDGFDFDCEEVEDQIADLIDRNSAVSFRCVNCNKYFHGKEVLVQDD